MFKEEDVFTVIITAVYTFIIVSFIFHIILCIYLVSVIQSFV